MLKEIRNSHEWMDRLNTILVKDIYYTYEYIKAFECHGDGTPVLFYFENATMKAINAVVLRKIDNDLFDLSTPYGYGGWICEGNISINSLKQLDQEYTKYCKDNNIVSEFVRFHPLLQNAKSMKDIYQVIDLGNTISLDLSTEEIIWQNITSKNRNVIRKAIKNGIQIGVSDDYSMYETFKTIYDETMHRDNADQYYYFEDEFYRKIHELLKGHSKIYYAIYNDQVIGASIIMDYGNFVHYHLSGAKREYMNLAPMNYLLYKVACDYSKLGYKLFHLGGGVGSDSESGLYKFKESFNKNGTNQFSIGKKIFDIEKYNKLVTQRGKEKDFNLNSNFFPLYRA